MQSGTQKEGKGSSSEMKSEARDKNVCKIGVPSPRHKDETAYLRPMLDFKGFSVFFSGVRGGEKDENLRAHRPWAP